MTTTFSDELEFESALIKVLQSKGWNKEVLRYPTEEDLIKNWADILYQNNCDKDHLNNVPLSQKEMKQLIDKVNNLKTPASLNDFINGRTVSIIRDSDSPDERHRGLDISLKIYDRQEIAGGKSKYQIVEQPIFKKPKNDVLPDRRGDIMLLINGMPVIHVELKKSGIDIAEACHQIEKYSHENIFTGIFSLIQVFVAMNPEETKYFANPGKDNFNDAFYFHWADFNNEPVNDWKSIAETLLSIPMAHQLIGFYTVSDKTDNTLKVLRPYQYFAAKQIAEKVAKIDWTAKHDLGGYIFATTGSGKSLTSFKSAQLIASSHDADKVVFLLDRIELGIQSVENYKNFATLYEDIQETEDSTALLSKLKSDDASDTLIVTSIQKMSKIKNESSISRDLLKINSKRMIVIVDECHRDTFGLMMQEIKKTFINAVFFGFTGTPIFDENSRENITTNMIFGDELHRYSIANGIKDKNVLGFDITAVYTFDYTELKKKVALEAVKANSEQELKSDKERQQKYLEIINKSNLEIEKYIKPSQYQTKKHQETVVEDISKNWTHTSCFNKFHALLSVPSIKEAIEYYRLFKEKFPELKVTSLFDKNIDNSEGFEFKEDGLVEIIKDYNKTYDKDFSITDPRFKKDISARLAHKKPYQNLKDGQQIDILIVVDQMLTGYDSKWINTLYLDKRLKNEQIIQAFSRTNRIFGTEKPFGIIRYYRYPYTMERNISDAVKLYSGENEFGIFVDKLPENIEGINKCFANIKLIFRNIPSFSQLPEDKDDILKFASEFSTMVNKYLTPALAQGMKWDDDRLEITESQYKILLQRFSEIKISKGNSKEIDFPYQLNKYLTSADSQKIDADYMESNFHKFTKLLTIKNATEDEINAVLNTLHNSFLTLDQKKQKIANSIIYEIQTGELIVPENKRINDIINERLMEESERNNQRLNEYFGIDTKLLKEMLLYKNTETTINEYGRYDKLIETIDNEKVKNFFSELNIDLPIWRLKTKVNKIIKDFILLNGDIEKVFENNDIKINDFKNKNELNSSCKTNAEIVNFGTDNYPKNMEIESCNSGGNLMFENFKNDFIFGNEDIFNSLISTPGVPVTQRIKMITQPYGGYLNPKEMSEIPYNDGLFLGDHENIPPQSMGLVVDYLTRLMVEHDKKTAFEISLLGAWHAENYYFGSIQKAEKLLDEINENKLDEITIKNACELVRFDVWIRSINSAMKMEMNKKIIPDKNTIQNIRIMVDRSLTFIKNYGPVIKYGFDFLPNGYTNLVCSGDGDFLTQDTLWDFKVSKNKPNSKQTLQLLMYYIMGKHSGQSIYNDIYKIGIFNPRMNIAFVYDMLKFDTELYKQIEKDVIGY